MKRSIINRSAFTLSLLLSLCASASLAQSGRAPTAQPTPTPSPRAQRPPDTTPGKPRLRLDLSGDFDGPIYTNNVLGFTLTMPAGWQVQDKDVQERFAESAARNTEKITEGKPGAESSIERTMLLFIAIKPTKGAINPIIVAITEDVSLIFNIRTPHQYIQSMRSISEGAPLTFDEKITTEKINGVEFAVINAAPKVSNSTMPDVRQRYFVVLRRNHAIGFILTYVGAEQLQACMEVLNSFRLK